MIENSVKNYHSQSLLQSIADGISPAKTGRWFDHLTKSIAELTGAEQAFVSRLGGSDQYAQTLSIYDDGKHQENIVYALNDSLSLQTIRDGFCVYPDRANELLAGDLFLQKFKPKAFIGVHLTDHNGLLVGLLGTLHSAAVDNHDDLLNLLRIFAAPAAIELSRMAEHASHSQIEATLNEILSVAREAIISVDGESNIVLFNEGAESIFGYTAKEVTGESINCLLPEVLRENHKAQIKEFRDSPEISRFMSQRSGDIVAQRKNGEIFPAEASITKTDSDANTITVVLRDITERLQSERALHSANRMQTLGNLAAGLAHDFNNILTLIRGSLDLLGSDTLDARQQQHYQEVAIRASDRGAELVSRLLAFGRPQTLNPEALKPAEMMEQLLDMLQVTLGEHIHIKLEKESSNCRVIADPTQLENAVVNLCFNAKDAMTTGGTLTLSTDCVELNDAAVLEELDLQRGRYALIKVQDTGTGMTKEDQDSATEPFFSTKLESGGSGLGLSMVLGFVKSASGAMRIDSTVGQGTLIELYLPEFKESTATTTANGCDSSPNKASILIVEDQPDVRELAVHYAKSLGYDVLDAEDGIKALQLLEENPAIDLIFTDFQLPGGISGLDIAEKANLSYPDIKILISSGYGTQHVDLAKYPLLPKPYSFQTFAKYVEKILDE